MSRRTIKEFSDETLAFIDYAWANGIPVDMPIGMNKEEKRKFFSNCASKTKSIEKGFSDETLAFIDDAWANGKPVDMPKGMSYEQFVKWMNNPVKI